MDIGTKSGMIDAFVLPRKEASRLQIETSLLFPYAYRGAEVERYTTVKPDGVVIYPYREGQDGSPDLIPELELAEKYPNTHTYLLGFKSELRKRQDSRRLDATGQDWYRHLRPGSFRYIRPAKLALKGIAMRCTAGSSLRTRHSMVLAAQAIILENLAGSHLNYFLGFLNSGWQRIICELFARQSCQATSSSARWAFPVFRLRNRPL